MKNIFAIIFSLQLFSSCSTQDDSEKSLKEIISADKEMSDLALKEGFFKAIYEYADENIVKLDEGNYPVVGKKALGEYYGTETGPKTISWTPTNVEVAKSGELGYTWGNWKFAKKDTTFYGNYFTAWKKDKDGKWKVVLDGGNNSPAPKN